MFHTTGIDLNEYCDLKSFCRCDRRPVQIGNSTWEAADFHDVIIIGGGVTGCATAYFLPAGRVHGSVLVNSPIGGHEFELTL